ncbi:phosphatase PAP2 family protein [Variovorax sp. J22R133]|uniref:phosphatase PAP2 family protein n=1 Tax=Variovorax brevis TaxID=3053503 RepID=UPI0025765614|nr:phosphatase PAP2 family protein [Variovorax sp. J22R133]MDM0114994.1 phosphatase PAP2 family protein [Variovorax sp. J22R133]
MPITPPRAPWTVEIGERLRSHLLLKLVGTTAWIWVFFIGYFHLLRYPVGAVTVMPLTPLDALVPFHAPWLIPYFSLWVYVGVAPGLQRSFRSLLVYGLWAAALCLAGLVLFFIWPTRIPSMPYDAGGFPGYAMLQGIDAAGNACPSMHVAIAIFTAYWIEHVLKGARVPVVLRAVNLLWFLAIAYSTLATRQHVVLDVLAGAVLGSVFAWASFRWRPSPRGTAGAARSVAVLNRR